VWVKRPNDAPVPARPIQLNWITAATGPGLE